MKPSMAPREREIIDNYREMLWSPRRYELVLGICLYVAITAYLFGFGSKFLVSWLGKDLNPILISITLVLLWDVSYRLGLGIWLTTISFIRSRRLRIASKLRKEMRYTPRRELEVLKRLDLICLSFGQATLLLYPLCSNDLILLVLLLSCSFYMMALSSISWLTIDSIPRFAPEILTLLQNGKFAYVGTSDRKGQPHVTPVIFVFDGKKPYFVTSKIAKKIRNLRENPRVAFLVDVRDPSRLLSNRAVLIMGKARIFFFAGAIIGLVTMLRVRRLFHRKYPQYMKRYRDEEIRLPQAWKTTMFASRMLVRVDVERLVYWQEAHPISLPA